MADGVAAQLDIGRLPAAERRGVRREARGDAEIVQQPIRLEAQKILRIELHRLLERAVEQTHIGQRKGARERRHFVRHGRRRCVRPKRGDRDGRADTSDRENDRVQPFHASPPLIHKGSRRPFRLSPDCSTHSRERRRCGRR